MFEYAEYIQRITCIHLCLHKLYSLSLLQPYVLCLLYLYKSLEHSLTAFPGIPIFPNHAAHRRHILIHMAAVFRDFSRRGFTEGMAGHISVRDPEFENYIWMNPLGRHFGLMTAGDMMCLDLESGKVVGGNRVCISTCNP